VGDLHRLGDGGIVFGLEAQPDRTRELIKSALVEMESTTTYVDKLTSRYGLQLLPVNSSATPNESIVKLAGD
jgi:hypothetical protein